MRIIVQNSNKWTKPTEREELIRLQRENARLSGELATALRENRDLRTGKIPIGQTTTPEPTMSRATDAIIAAAANAVATKGISNSPTSLEGELTLISSEASTNSGAAAIGSLADGRLRSVGFATAEGYEEAIRRGVPARTHALYVSVLGSRFGRTNAYLASLPGPAQPTSLPEGRGVTHVPTGTPLFNRPPSERRFLVGEAAARPAVASAPQAQPAQRSRASRVMQIRAGSTPVRRAPIAPLTPLARPPPSPSSARPSPEIGEGPRRGDGGKEPEDEAAERFALLELD